jgi:IS4 transposase
MAKINEEKVRGKLMQILPDEWVRAMAKTSGAVVRERKVDIVLFIWTLILGFATSGGNRTIASLRRAYEHASGEGIEESSFYDRFTEGFVRLIRECLCHAMRASFETEGAMNGLLKNFWDLIVTDSTVVRLHKMLKDRFPGNRTNHSPASVKMHAVLSVRAHGISSIKITEGKKADVKVFTVGPWVKSALLIFDLGYYCLGLFSRIDRNLGYFISRLKDNANPTVVGSYIKHRGRKTIIEGRPLQEVLKKLKRDVVDFQCCFRFKTRRYQGSQTIHEQIFRVVGVRNAETGQFHLYVTNVHPELLSPAEISRVYRYRWEIELLFKELKGCYHLEDLNTRNEQVVLALLYAAIITSIVARTLQVAFAQQFPNSQRKRITTRRFAAIFASVASRLLELISISIGITQSATQRAINVMITEILDPNRSRSLITQEIALLTDH